MSCKSETIDLLRHTGHKMTPQRMMILTSLRHASGHLTAANILDHEGSLPVRRHLDRLPDTDGIDGNSVSRNSGAESNIEGGLALMDSLPWDAYGDTGHDYALSVHRIIHGRPA